MSYSFEWTLHSPLTKEDWNKIADVEHEKTTSVTFQTPQGRQVRYIKCEVLDKIRAEIESQRKEVSKKHFENDDELQAYHFGLNDGLKDARDILDKYIEESEG